MRVKAVPLLQKAVADPAALKALRLLRQEAKRQIAADIEKYNSCLLNYKRPWRTANATGICKYNQGRDTL